MPTKRSLNRQLADARAQVRRLADARTEATSDAGPSDSTPPASPSSWTRPGRRSTELRRQLAARPTTPAVAPDAWPAERARLRQLLDLSERARASLDAQVLQLGQINEQQAREAYDRAVAAEVTR
jgi:hypothetical protein